MYILGYIDNKIRKNIRGDFEENNHAGTNAIIYLI